MKGIHAVPQIMAGFIVIAIGAIIVLHRILQRLPENDLSIIPWSVILFVGTLLIIVGTVTINDGTKKL